MFVKAKLNSYTKYKKHIAEVKNKYKTMCIHHCNGTT